MTKKSAILSIGLAGAGCGGVPNLPPNFEAGMGKLAGITASVEAQAPKPKSEDELCGLSRAMAEEIARLFLENHWIPDGDSKPSERYGVRQSRGYHLEVYPGIVTSDVTLFALATRAGLRSAQASVGVDALGFYLSGSLVASQAALDGRALGVHTTPVSKGIAFVDIQRGGSPGIISLVCPSPEGEIKNQREALARFADGLFDEPLSK